MPTTATGGEWVPWISTKTHLQGSAWALAGAEIIEKKDKLKLLQLPWVVLVQQV